MCAAEKLKDCLKEQLCAEKLNQQLCFLAEKMQQAQKTVLLYVAKKLKGCPTEYPCAEKPDRQQMCFLTE